MAHPDNVIDIHRPVEFSIDGRSYRSTPRRRTAADLLRLAGRDPERFTLGELRAQRLRPLRYRRTDVVDLHRGTCLVTLATADEVAAR
jgi:hypothetical protein